MPSKGMDGGVTMIKDLGHLGVNGLSYNWGNMGIAFGGSQAESKQNQDLANLSKAVTIGADSHATAIGFAKVLSKDAGAALKGLSRTGIVVDAIAGGIPASINLISSFRNGEIGSLHDWVSFGIAGLGVLSEFTGLGEGYDGSVGLIIAGGSLIYDTYDAATSD